MRWGRHSDRRVGQTVPRGTGGYRKTRWTGLDGSWGGSWGMQKCGTDRQKVKGGGGGHSDRRVGQTGKRVR